MKITKWYSKEECKNLIEPFIKKFDEDSLTVKDTTLFFKALYGAMCISYEEEEDEEKQEIWENMKSDMDEFGTSAYCIEIRENNGQYIIKIKPDGITMGEYEGEYDPSSITDVKNVIWIDWTPACQLKIMYGNPNTTPEFFSGDCTVKGSTKLGAKPRGWIYDLFAFIEREAKA
ncbi:MAG: hypothetical protein ACFFD2_24115 [Promethearchaeota archaeon]